MRRVTAKLNVKLPTLIFGEKHEQANHLPGHLGKELRKGSFQQSR